MINDGMQPYLSFFLFFVAVLKIHHVASPKFAKTALSRVFLTIVLYDRSNNQTHSPTQRNVIFYLHTDVNKSYK